MNTRSSLPVGLAAKILLAILLFALALAPRATAQPSGYALDFSPGAGNYVSVNLTTPPLSNYTLTAWVKLRTGGNNSGTRMAVLSGTACPGSIEFLIHAWDDNPGSPQYLELGRCGAFNGSQAATNANSVPLNTWTHVAVTISTNKIVKYYINGSPSGSWTNNALDFSFSSTVRLGANNGFRAFDGLLDNFQMWSRELSAAEVLANVTQQLTGNESGLYAWYPFNEGSGGTAPNKAIAAGGSTGTLVNNPQWTSVTQTVTTVSDSGLGSLRQAITAINGSGVPGTVNFDPALSGQTITLTSGQLPLNANTIIDGRSLASPVTVSGGNTTRIFNQATNTTCVLRGLTLTGGFSTNGGAIYNNGGALTLGNCILSGNQTPQTNSANTGGAIYNGGGAVVLTNCTLSSNQSAHGGAIESIGGTLGLTNCSFANNFTRDFSSVGFYGEGGAIRNSGQLALADCALTANSSTSGGTILNSGAATLTHCTFTNNFGGNSGGSAIGNVGGSVTLTDCILSGGRGHQYSGAVYNSGGTVTINNSTYFDNDESPGGAIANYSGQMSINNSTLSSNSPAFYSGGTLTINNSTICSNTTSSGVYGTVLLNNSTYANNLDGISLSFGTLVLNNSTVSGNTATNAYNPGVIYTDTNSWASVTLLLTNTIVTGNNSPTNIFGPFSGANNLTNGDPLLAPLGNYGGPTQTMPPLPGSPAIDAGLDSVTNLLTVDQRGKPRLAATHVDLGAVEAYYQAVVTTVSDSGPGSLRDTVANVDTGASITFAPALSGQTITLTSGQITLSNSVTIDASPLSGGIQISGNNSSRVFDVASGAVVALESLTIKNGFPNSAPTAGGGIRNSGTLTVNRCAIVGNSSGSGGNGGGIANPGGNLVLNQCTITGNSAAVRGGGLASTVNAIVNQCTITDNSASSLGGGVHLSGGTITISNSIVAGNTASSGGTSNLSGAITLSGANLTTSNPLLAPLGNYGGPTQSMPPLPGSPAIDGATNGTSFTTDQRGLPRIVGAFADLGAVEGVLNRAFPLVNVTKPGDGNMQFAFTNLSGPGYRVLASTNVAAPINTWSNLGAPTESPAGTFTFTDLQSTNYPSRFYRVTMP